MSCYGNRERLIGTVGIIMGVASFTEDARVRAVLSMVVDELADVLDTSYITDKQTLADPETVKTWSDAMGWKKEDMKHE